MLEGHDVIVFSDDWGRHPFSCQHILRHFMPSNRVLWVNTIGMRLPRFSLYDMRRAAEKLRSWVVPTSQPGGAGAASAATIPQGLRVISPVMIPFAPLPPVRAFNRRSVVEAVRRNAREMGFRNPVLLATVPNAADYVGHCGESLVVYYCVDEFRVWPGMNLPDMVRNLEAHLMRDAHLVVAVSDALARTKGNGRTATRLLTHGVDMAHFAKAAAPQAPPEELADLHGPVVGFFGLIDSHLDVDIVEHILAARPQWNVVLIGTRRIPLTRLERHARFRWLPAVPYAELPRYASRFDVAIIPYVVNEHTCTANPLKLKEYMATGKPVVTTPMPEALRYAACLHVAPDGAGFVQAIERELDVPSDAAPRLAALDGETWHHKAELLAAWIEESLVARNATNVVRRATNPPGNGGAVTPAEVHGGAVGGGIASDCGHHALFGHARDDTGPVDVASACVRRGGGCS